MFSKENRLIGYLASSFNVTSKPTTRGGTVTLKPTPQVATPPPAPKQDPYYTPTLNSQGTPSGLPGVGSQVMPYNDPYYKLKGSGNPVYSSTVQLKSALDQGIITAAQFEAAKNQLLKGYTGVDPLGFNAGSVLPQVGGAPGANIPGQAGRQPWDGTPLSDGVDRDPSHAPPGGDIRVPGGTQTTPGGSGQPYIPPRTGNVKTDPLTGKPVGWIDIDAMRPYSGEGHAGVPESAEAFQRRVSAAEEHNTNLLKQQQIEIQNKQSEQQHQKTSVAPSMITPTPNPNANPIVQDVETSITDWQSVMETAKGLSPEIYAAYLPGIQARLSQAMQLRTDISSLEATDVTQDPTVLAATKRVDAREKVLDNRLAENKRIAEENKNIQLEAAAITRDMMSLDKEIIEARNKDDEQRQIKKNIKDEKRTRRELNSAGLETSPLGLDYLSNKIQDGLDTLSTLRQTNNLTILKADLAIGRGYTNAVDTILNAYEEKRSILEAANDDAIESLEDVISQATSTASKDKREKLKTMYDQISKLEIEAADKIAESMKEMQSAAKDARKAEQDNIIKTKDTLGFISDVSKEIGNNSIIKNARSVNTQFNALSSEYSRAQTSDKEGKQFSDQTLISLFNKILDPTSVVREAEYNRSAENLSIADQAWATFQKYKSGGVLNPKVRTELFSAAKTLNDTYKKQLQDELQPYISRANVFNSQDGVQTKVKLQDIIPLNLVSLPTETIDMWKTQMGKTDSAPSTVATYDTTGTENTAGIAGWLSPEGAPENGYRTDRHNNPTAFTVDIAKQAGLVEGVDYEVGDKFKGGTTAKLLGDPIMQTIRVIDKIGFHTQKGGQRWTHTAMSDDDWNSLTMNQKQNVVAQMYQREGGTGVLAQGITGVALPTYGGTPEPEPTVPTSDDLIKDLPPVTTPIKANMGTGMGPGSVMTGGAQPSAEATKTLIGYKDNKTGTVTSGLSERYNSDLIKYVLANPDKFTPIYK